MVFPVDDVVLDEAVPQARVGGGPPEGVGEGEERETRGAEFDVLDEEVDVFGAGVCGDGCGLGLLLNLRLHLINSRLHGR